MKLLQTGSRILASRIGQAILIALTGLLVARVLGPSGQGHFSLTLLVVMLGAALLNGGVGLAAVPPLRRGEVSLGEMLQAQLAWVVLVGIFLLLAGSILGRTHLIDLARSQLGWNHGTAVLAGIAILALLAFEVFFYDLLAEGRIVTGPVINLSRAMLHLVLVVGLLLQDRLDLERAVLAYAAAQLFAAVTVGLLLATRTRRARGSPADHRGPSQPPAVDDVPAAAAGRSPPLTGFGPAAGLPSDGEARSSMPAALASGVSLGHLMRQNLRRGWLGQLSAVASLLHLRLDQAIVSAFWGAAVVGVYSVAVLAGEMLWLIAGALSPVLVFTSASREEADLRDRLAARAVRVGLLATATVALPIGILASPLILFFYGPAYSGSVGALRALLPGIVAFAPAAILAGDFIGRGKPGWNTQASLLTLVVNVGCGLLLIPRQGAVGAAWASTIAYVVGAAAMIGRFQGTTGLSWAEIFRPHWTDFQR